jgi:hypothetical protein
MLQIYLHKNRTLYSMKKEVISPSNLSASLKYHYFYRQRRRNIKERDIAEMLNN